MNKREYAKTNLDWLAAKAEEEGVMALPEGIYYKVLSSGNNDGKHPTPRSIVTVHYTGRTINGKKFDSSRGGSPIAFRLSDLIKGWIVAMQQMCVGDKWEVYIPANKNSIANDPESPFVTSGIRIGTPAITTRGFKEEDMPKVAELIKLAAVDFENKADYIRSEVNKLCEKYPLFD